MKHVVEQKCPHCGAAMRFDPEKGKLICDYCGGSADIPEETAVEETQVHGLDFGVWNAQATQEGAPSLPVYYCRSCGAELIAPAQQFALTCPYCSNNIVLTDKVTGTLRPDGLIPFRVDAKSLPGTVQRFYQDKVLLPKGFFSESVMGKVTGVYVPFWVFEGRMTGVLRYRGRNVTHSRQGDYDVTDTSYYEVSRNVDLSFSNVPVDASGRIDDDLMDSLEPFRMEEVKPFDMGYLAGFTADRFDLAREETAGRARERMIHTAEQVVQNRVGRDYESITRTGGELNSQLKARYLLFPVYLFDVAHGGQSYRFAVNGQTGKVVGDVPTDGKLSRRYFLLRAGGVLLALVGGLFVRYLLGG